MPPRKSDARKSDVSFADAGDTSIQPVDSQADESAKTAAADKKDAITIEVRYDTYAIANTTPEAS